MLFLILALMSIAVFGVSFNMWLFFFLGIAYSKGHQNVSSSVFTNLKAAGRVAIGSVIVAMLSGVGFFLSYQS